MALGDVQPTHGKDVLGYIVFMRTKDQEGDQKTSGDENRRKLS